MLRKLLPLLLLIGCSVWAQPITVSTTTYTPSELLNDVLPATGCGTIALNVTSSAACGIGYFENNAGSFPFANGMILRTGNANLSSGPYTETMITSSCSNVTDTDLSTLNSQTGIQTPVNDATYVKFNFQPASDVVSFNFIYASNEYGQYQCSFSDTFAFILTDVTTGTKVNLAVVPGTNIRVSGLTVRSNQYNGSCASMNEDYFDSYNVNNPNSATSFAGQTVPMTAMATVNLTHVYELKLVIGDNGDAASDSAVFIEGGSFNLGACQNAIKMSAFIDSNANNVKDDGEPEFTDGAFSYEINNSGSIAQSISSYGDAYINVMDITDSYDLNFTVNAEYTPYFSASSAYTDVSYNENGSNTYYFPVINTVPFAEASVYVVPSGSPRPGFNYIQKVIYSNNGFYNTVSGSIAFNADPLVTVTAVSEAGASMTANGFTYDFTGLLPGETKVIYVTLSVPVIPTVNLGDLLTSAASITVAGDAFSDNNNSILTQIVIGSYDPNDKTESHGGDIMITDFNADDYLYYTINFQNTGTADAVNVHIDDILDSKLDEESIRMIASSHNCVMERRDNELRWNLDYIYLPGSIESEANSKGFVTFKIKPKPGYAIGDIIPNNASIYFDFNPAIVTNTVNTEFTAPLGINTFDRNVSVYPNPATNLLNISLHDAENITAITITDVLGKQVLKVLPQENTAAINVSSLNSGLYFVTIETATQKTVKKIVIR